VKEITATCSVGPSNQERLRVVPVEADLIHGLGTKTDIHTICFTNVYTNQWLKCSAAARRRAGEANHKKKEDYEGNLLV
jgi:hypothetical protein